jgi:MFS family permease
MALLFVLVSPFSGALTDRLGTRLMSGGGVAVIGTGLLLIGLTAGSASMVPAELGLGLTGIGMGLATGLASAVNTVVPARSGTAAALINVARMVGATIGVAILGAVYAMGRDGFDGLRIACCSAAPSS